MSDPRPLATEPPPSCFGCHKLRFQPIGGGNPSVEIPAYPLGGDFTCAKLGAYLGPDALLPHPITTTCKETR